MTGMRECPFCGGNKLKIDGKRSRAGYTGLDDIVYVDRYSVRCLRCYARGGIATGRVLLGIRAVSNVPEWITTADSLKEAAVAAWNRRVTND